MTKKIRLAACFAIALTVFIVALPQTAFALSPTAISMNIAAGFPNANTTINVSLPYTPPDNVSSPTGTITLLLNGFPHSSQPAGANQFQIALPGGTYTASVAYSGDNVFEGSSTPSQVFSVKFPPPAFPGDFSCPPGSGAAQTCLPNYDEGAAVPFGVSPGLISGQWWQTLGRPAPSGTVTFSLNGTTLATAPLVNGSAETKISTLPPGRQCVLLSWPGDVNYEPPSPNSYCVWIVQGPGHGYRLVTDDGRAQNFGVSDLGSMLGKHLNAPIVGTATTPTRRGYWQVGRDGGVFSFGDARFFGSTGNIALNQPVVGMTATPSGQGYWFVAADGGIFAYGDAQFYGSTGATRLNQPVVGMAATPSGRGYWLVARDGGIFAYGDAQFYGSTGNLKLNRPVVGMARSGSGNGYWFVASDGGIFAYGDARFVGSAGSLPLAQPIVGMATTPSGNGYWLTALDGGIFNYGDAVFLGSIGSLAAGRVAAISAQ